MINTGESFPTHEPSNPNGSGEGGGYRAQFYPGFVRRLSVVGTDGTVTELYNQNGRHFFLPPGLQKPWPTSTLAVTGPNGRIALQIEDPNQQIGRIEIYLKGPTGAVRCSTVIDGGVEVSGVLDVGVSATAAPQAGDPGPVVVCEDGPVLCPPMCPEGPG